jgi:hypothetical protein
MTYWEYNRPYNQQHHVTTKTSYIVQTSTSVQTNISLSDSYFSLERIQNYTCNTELINTRQSIGNGIKIWLENEKIWLKNMTKNNIFWIQPNNLPNSRRIETTVQFLAPSSSTIIYDYQKMEKKLAENEYLKLFDPHVINISFVKSWGSSKRMSIEQCPCWVNLSVNIDYLVMMREINDKSKKPKCIFM